MVVSRIYIGPFVEKIEVLTQITIIKLSKRFPKVRAMFSSILVKQMAAQLQLMSLNEFNAKKKKRLDENENHQSN